MHNIAKKLLLVVALFLSPLVLLACVGTVYVVIQIINGMSPMAGINSFITWVHTLMPYFPYLTTIPVVMIALTLLIKNWSKVKVRIRQLVK